MEYDITNLTDYNLDLTKLDKVIKCTSEKLNIKDKYISIVFVNNEKIHEINKTYRNVDRPTDVISFAFLDNFDIDDTSLGEIYISVDKIKEQAISYNHSELREECFLLVHGLLHLLGYDHMKKEDETVMFKLQEEILNEVGVNR